MKLEKELDRTVISQLSLIVGLNKAVTREVVANYLITLRRW